MADDASSLPEHEHEAQAPSEQVTRVLQDFGHRPSASDELLAMVYDQLRAIAERRMASERRGHTLDATALVHEAYMRLVGNRDMHWRDRGHFYGAAAEAMRRILIDHARKCGRQKRGGGRKALPLSVVDLAQDFDPDRVLALDEAIATLAEEDERAAQVVRLRFFGGLEVSETAEALDISERTVMREWAYARARLFQILGPDMLEQDAPG